MSSSVPVQIAETSVATPEVLFEVLPEWVGSADLRREGTAAVITSAMSTAVRSAEGIAACENHVMRSDCYLLLVLVERTDVTRIRLLRTRGYGQVEPQQYFISPTSARALFRVPTAWTVFYTLL